MHHPHNFFRFATRELSHSAFWAWVLQAVDRSAPEFDGPKELGERLLETLDAPSSPSSIKVETERPLPANAGRADIWAEVGHTHVVVIENKMSAVPSPSQIERYQDALARESRILRLCLLSTAFDEEVRAEFELDPECHFMSAENVLSMFDGVTQDHPLLRDYHEWLSGVLARRERNRRWVFSSNDEELVEALATREGQWELLKELTESMTGRQYRGTNRGGRPWTQYRFVEEGEDGPDAMFYRIDQSSRGYYLSVRQYQATPQPDWAAKKARRKLLRSVWKEAVAETQADLAFERPRNWGRKESEIAWLLFRRNPVATVIEQIPKIHEEFLYRLGINPPPQDG